MMTQLLRLNLLLLVAGLMMAQSSGSDDRSRQSWFGGANRSRISAAAREEMPMQPLAQQIRRVESALELLGQPLDFKTKQLVDEAISQANEKAGVHLLEQALESYVLASVNVNAESRVKVERGAAAAELVKGGSRFFLVKVVNQAGVTSPLVVSSPNNGDVYITSDGSPEPAMVLTQADVRDRWAEISLANSPPAAATTVRGSFGISDY